MAIAQEVNLSDLAPYFARLGDRMQRIDFKPALQDCKLLLVRRTREHFVKGQSPDGVPWAPVKMRVRGSAGAAKPLRDRGLLMASVTSRAAGNVERITNSTLEYGTNLEYAAIHQFGGTIRARNAKYLAIPVSREAYRAGSPRNFAGQLRFVPSRSGRGGRFVERNPQGKPLVTHYVLVQSVQIPARPFLGLTRSGLACG